MSDFIKITEMPAAELPAYVDGMDQRMRDWTDKAARGECGWICSDCCYSFSEGMPDECVHGLQQCTEIIRRDKQSAMLAGNEPS